MKRLILVGWLPVVLAGAQVLTGCSPSASTTNGATSKAATNAVAPGIPGVPTHAQAKLQTMKLWMGNQEMVAELALTPEEQETGMMFRTNMGANEGMLFPMAAPGQVSFWMMNCPLPLQAAYIATDGSILEIHDFIPYDTNSIVSATANVQFVLEAPKDYFTSNNLHVGTVITTEHGPMHSVFVPGR